MCRQRRHGTTGDLVHRVQFLLLFLQESVPRVLAGHEIVISIGIPSRAGAIDPWLLRRLAVSVESVAHALVLIQMSLNFTPNCVLLRLELRIVVHPHAAFVRCKLPELLMPPRNVRVFVPVASDPHARFQGGAGPSSGRPSARNWRNPHASGLRAIGSTGWQPVPLIVRQTIPSDGCGGGWVWGAVIPRAVQ